MVLLQVVKINLSMYHQKEVRSKLGFQVCNLLRFMQSSLFLWFKIWEVNAYFLCDVKFGRWRIELPILDPQNEESKRLPTIKPPPQVVHINQLLR